MIRPATEADLPRVLELILALAEYERLLDRVTGSLEMLTEDFHRNAFWCNLAEVDGIVVGFTLGFRTYSTFRTRPGIWLEDLYVEPAHRGTGIGKALLQNVVEMGRAEGAGRVEWSVLDWNAPSIAFYEAFGAEVLPDWRICRISL